MQGCHDPAHHFYLPHPTLEALADCFAVVGGVQLPLHSQVLSAQSGVLRELFLGQAEGGVACEGHPDLTAAFAGASVAEVSCLLRLVYCPQDACPANFAWLASTGRLCAVAGLAHKLDVARPLAAIESYLEGISSYCNRGVAGLLVALQLAQSCRFHGVEARCLDALAAKLAAAAATQSERCQPIWEAALAALDATTLARLLCKTLAACNPGLSGFSSAGMAGSCTGGGSGGGTPVCLGAAQPLAGAAAAAAVVVGGGAPRPPTPPAIREVRHGSGGGFTWEIEGFSALQQQQQQQLQSPWVRLAGVDWRMVVYPRGVGAGKDTHLSVFLEMSRPGQGAAAPAGILSCSFTALCQAGEAADHSVTLSQPAPIAQQAPRGIWGFERFLALDELHSPERRLLVGDRLLLRADVAVGGDIVAL